MALPVASTRSLRAAALGPATISYPDSVTRVGLALLAQGSALLVPLHSVMAFQSPCCSSVSAPLKLQQL